MFIDVACEYTFEFVCGIFTVSEINVVRKLYKQSYFKLCYRFRVRSELTSVHTLRNSAHHRNSDRYYFVLENRISAQMDPQPIESDKWTK